MWRNGKVLRGDGLNDRCVIQCRRRSTTLCWDPVWLGRGVRVALIALLRAGDARRGASVVLIDVFGVTAVVLSAATFRRAFSLGLSL